MQEIIRKIKDFADQAHGDQMRKYTPERYIVHPERVMLICREYLDDVSVLGAALLHDVLEDTQVKPEEIRNFLASIMKDAQAHKTLHLVIELTDVYIKSAYPHFNRRERKKLETARLAKVSGTAQTIKYADLIDNAFDILKHDRGFGRKFIIESQNLLKHLTKGNAELRERAVKTLDRLSK